MTKFRIIQNLREDGSVFGRIDGITHFRLIHLFHVQWVKHTALSKINETAHETSGRPENHLYLSEAFNDLDMALRDDVFLEKGVPININYRLILQKIHSSSADSDSG